MDKMSKIEELRNDYHAQICAQVIFMKKNTMPSMADVANNLSRNISTNLMNLLRYPISQEEIDGQTAGKRLEEITKCFLSDVFGFLDHIRPGRWNFSVHDNISEFDQYRHLSDLAQLIRQNKTLKTALGDYVISPDIIVTRQPLSDEEINLKTKIVEVNEIPHFSPLRRNNNSYFILHASISCKWTLRSDRSQNARTEGLNLIRNRKGHTPHIVVVTGEPVPSRIASLALGTGDIDCVYHVALHELNQAVRQTQDDTAIETLEELIEGRRLRDISDLPFDLAI
jgi:hypothetical protein